MTTPWDSYIKPRHEGGMNGLLKMGKPLGKPLIGCHEFWTQTETMIGESDCITEKAV
jgi:hypothetical protein